MISCPTIALTAPKQAVFIGMVQGGDANLDGPSAYSWCLCWEIGDV